MMTDISALQAVLQEQYNITVDKIVTLKSVLGLVAVDRSRWIWKTARPKDTEWRLASLYTVAEYLEQTGICCAGPVHTVQREFLTALPTGEHGYLQPWYSGRHADFGNRDERLATVAQIAAMHEASRLLPQPLRQNLGTSSIALRLRKKQRAMQQAWPVARRHLPQLAVVENHVWQGMEQALGRLRLWYPTGTAAFCHRDLAPHNVLIEEGTNPEVTLIDLDQAGYDEPYLDILQLCNHALYFSEVEAGYFHEMLETYKDSAPLLPQQEQCVWDLLCFPDLLIRSTIEWVSQGCPPKGKTKVLLTAHKEEQRWQLLAQEAPWLRIS